MVTVTIEIKSKEHVIDLAKAMEAIKIEYENWGVMNTPIDVEKQVLARAHGAVLRSRLATATREYEKAFAEWENDKFGDTFASYSER